MSYQKPKLDLLTANREKMQLEIDLDRSLTAVIYGSVIGNWNVRLSAHELEQHGSFGVSVLNDCIGFNRCEVWLEPDAVNSVASFLADHGYRFYDARTRKAGVFS